MNLSEINWDYEAAGSWPLAIKMAVIALLSMLLLSGLVYYFTLEQLNELNQSEQQELELKRLFKVKQSKAVTLPAYRKQLKQIEASLEAIIKQMPAQADLDILLKNISQIGLKNGLELRLFQPQGTVLKDFYSETSVRIEVIGGYKGLGLFVSDLVALPRIVTLHNIVISVAATGYSLKADDPSLNMKAIIKTYNGESISEAAQTKKDNG